MEKLKSIFDLETVKVAVATVTPWWLTAEHFDIVLKLAASLGAVIYVWRKVIKNKD